MPSERLESVLGELRSSEKRYLNCLNVLIQSFVQAIEDKVNPRHLREIFPFFALLRSLHSFHHRFCNQLNGKDPVAVFKSNLRNFRLYIQYADSYPKAIINISRARESSRKFRAIADTPLPITPLIDVASILEQILYRVSQYYNILVVLAESPSSLSSPLPSPTSMSSSSFSSSSTHIDEAESIEQDIVEVCEDLRALAEHLENIINRRQTLEEKEFDLNSPQTPRLTPFTSRRNSFSVSSRVRDSVIDVVPTSGNEIIFRYVPRCVVQYHVSEYLKRKRDSTGSGRDSLSNKLAKESSSSKLPKDKIPDPKFVAYPSAVILMADVSGFTKLNETFATLEKGFGIEQVTNHLNKYFSSLLEIIERYGGDCVKFAGDALIVLFLPLNTWTNDIELVDGKKTENKESIASPKSHRRSLRSLLDNMCVTHLNRTQTATRAAQCALELQREVGIYRANGVGPNGCGIELQLHIAIASGTVYGNHVGGYNEEHEFLLSGTPFMQLNSCMELSKKGDVVVSKDVWNLIGKIGVGQPCHNPKSPTKTDGEVCITEIHAPLILPSYSPLPTHTLSQNAQITSAIRSYVPRAVQEGLDSNHLGTLAEIRTATVLFVNLRGLTSVHRECSDHTNMIHKICFMLQKIISRNQGYRRQFLFDDKGATMIVVFGVPPFAHENDALRGSRCAMEMAKALEDAQVSHTIGISTGIVYVGSVGSYHRQEHAVVGDVVNTAARLSGVFGDSMSKILCDEATYSKTYGKIEMKDEGEINVKGKSTKIKIFSPVKFDRMNELHANGKPVGETMSRGNEMKEFMQCLLTLQNDQIGNIMFVEAEAGVGKSHLIRNFYRIAANNPANFRILFGRGDATESSTMLAMWVPIIEQLLDLPPPLKNCSSMQKRTKKVNKFLKTVMPYSRKANPRLPFLNVLLSQPVSLPQTDLSKELKDDQEGTIQAAEILAYSIISSSVAYHATHGMLTVMFIEDAHLLDGASADVLLKVAQSVRPLLLVVSGRPPSLTEKVVPDEDKVNLRLDELLKTPEGENGTPTISRRSSLNSSFDVEDNSSTTASAFVTTTNSRETSVFGSSTRTVLRSETQVPILSSPTHHRTISAVHGQLANSGRRHTDVICHVWSKLHEEVLKLPQLIHIELQGLNLNSCSRLVCQRLGVKSVSPEAIALIMKRSRGNPLYAVEIANHLVEFGYFRVLEDGVCTVSIKGNDDKISGTDVDIPKSLQGLITRRLDNLSVLDLLVCKIASVLGTDSFETSILIHLAEVKKIQESQVITSLYNLVHTNIVAKREGSDETYEFCHEMLRTACYDMLLFSQKLRLHRKAAEIELERLRAQALELQMDGTLSSDIQSSDMLRSVNLTYHYTLALQSFVDDEHSIKADMKVFVAQARDYLHIVK